MMMQWTTFSNPLIKREDTEVPKNENLSLLYITRFLPGARAGSGLARRMHPDSRRALSEDHPDDLRR